MRYPAKSVSAAAIMLALGGCGASNAATGKSRQKTVSKAAPEPMAIVFKSPTIRRSIPALYTCDGQDISPPLEWGAVPPRTREVTLFVLGLTPSSGHTATVSVEWALAGVSPALHRLTAGEVPRGAHLGLNEHNTTRYSVCPPRGRKERYEFLLYTVPDSLIALPAKFKGVQVLSALSSRQGSTANGGGGFVASYTRK